MKTVEFAEGLVALAQAEGFVVRFLDGWDSPARNGYVWREDNDLPAGHMHHHTASSSYNPNRDKANGYAGLGREGTLRLYQENYGDDQMFPVYTVANAYPAPISSGAGDIEVLKKVRKGIEVDGRNGPDTSGWYGNTHYWNTEWVLNGTGAPIDERVWNMMVKVCQYQNQVMGWTRANHIGHGHHTRRKIDLRGGQFTDFDDTINHLRDDIDSGVVPPPVTPPPVSDETYKELEYSDGFNSNPKNRVAVAGLQGALKLAGYEDENSQSDDGVDGKYGNGTKTAVSNFQRDTGLPVTGKADSRTRSELEKQPAKE